MLESEIQRQLEAAPEWSHGVAGVRASEGRAELLFLGKGTPPVQSDPLPLSWVPSGIARARLHQVHGAAVVEAQPGECGEADALVTSRAALALEIATADCVPVLLAGGNCVAAVHAGWRGIAAGVVPATARRMGNAADLTAWIGPAIGPCCYEVGEDVAHAVAAASTHGVVRGGRRGRPHLDLQLAVETQLRAAGWSRVRVVRRCTACESDWLWSYRRDGPAAGRNLALIRLRG